ATRGVAMDGTRSRCPVSSGADPMRTTWPTAAGWDDDVRSRVVRGLLPVRFRHPRLVLLADPERGDRDHPPHVDRDGGAHAAHAEEHPLDVADATTCSGDEAPPGAVQGR